MHGCSLSVPFIHSDIFGCNMCKALYFVLLEIETCDTKQKIVDFFLSVMMTNKSMYSQSLHFCQKRQAVTNSKICNMLVIHTKGK